MRNRLFAVLAVILVILSLGFSVHPEISGAEHPIGAAHSSGAEEFSAAGGFIKWVDFNVPRRVLKAAYDLDVKSFGKLPRFKFCEMLAYLASVNGNNFNSKRDIVRLKSLVQKLSEGKTMDDLTKDNKYYSYYLECYEAIFSEFIGEYIDQDGKVGYGLKAYHPIARGYGYNDYDDFGNPRSYGFRRVHLGHDIFARTGTPIIATEGGVITECGWNQYGGWRVGIRSFDGKRFYYYAHMRKNHPYAPGIEKGARIAAGQVIGYVGSTGYSRKENKNMKVNPHLHYGIQLIFDESQVKGKHEIWIDVYAITGFLTQNRATVQRIEGGKDFQSINLKKSLTPPSRFPLK